MTKNQTDGVGAMFVLVGVFGMGCVIGTTLGSTALAIYLSIVSFVTGVRLLRSKK